MKYNYRLSFLAEKLLIGVGAILFILDFSPFLSLVLTPNLPIPFLQYIWGSLTGQYGWYAHIGLVIFFWGVYLYSNGEVFKKKQVFKNALVLLLTMGSIGAFLRSLYYTFQFGIFEGLVGLYGWGLHAGLLFSVLGVKYLRRNPLRKENTSRHKTLEPALNRFHLLSVLKFFGSLFVDVVRWRPDIRAGILTSFIKPKGPVKNDYEWEFSGLYMFLQYATLLLNGAWLLSIPFMIFDYENSADGFVRITVAAIIAELLYKALHHKYRYF